MLQNNLKFRADNQQDVLAFWTNANKWCESNGRFFSVINWRSPDGDETVIEATTNIPIERLRALMSEVPNGDAMAKTLIGIGQPSEVRWRRG